MLPVLWYGDSSMKPDDPVSVLPIILISDDVLRKTEKNHSNLIPVSTISLPSSSSICPSTPVTSSLSFLQNGKTDIPRELEIKNSEKTI